MRLAATPESTLTRRVPTLLVGIVIVAVGVACTIRAELGVAPYDVLTTGIADRTGLPVGAAAVVVPVVLVALGLALGGRAGVGTVVAMVAVGPVIGAALALVPEASSLAVRIPLFAGGSLLVALGITAVVIAELGPGPAELVMLAIHDRGPGLALVRTALELGFLATGWALGGQVGIGTAVVALSIGPVLRALLAAAGYRAADPAACDDAALRAAPGV